MSDADALEVEVAGETLLLHAQRALIWPARATLFIADLHLGKSESLRRAGIAAPEGSTTEDLERLTMLVRRYHLSQIVVLGDFLHRSLPGPTLYDPAFTAWRECNGQLEFIVVAGNHDRRAVGREFTRAVQWRTPEWAMRPFVCRHCPRASTAGYVLCGHVHPVVSLRASRRERLRAPVFWRRRDHMVLPSFGSFTGGAEIEPTAEDDLFAVAGGGVWRLPRYV